MTNAHQLRPFARRGRINRQGFLVFCVWTAIVGASFWWNERQTSGQVLALAATEAKANLSRDLAFRRWATDHGGIYVRVDEKTQPNPYLAGLPERDVVTADGGMLTLYNPATALREIMERYTELYGVKARITGLKVINPVDRPDAWEEKALRAIEVTRRDFIEVADLGGQPYLRMLQPMIMEEGCVKCHAWTGIKVGEIRGATAVAVPLGPYLKIQAGALRDIGLTHGGLWLIGVGVIGFAARRAKRHAGEAEQAARVLVDSEERVRLLLESTAEGLLATDMRGQCTLANPAAVRLLGYDSQRQLVGREIAEITRLAEAAPSAATAGGAIARSHGDSRMFRADGSSFPIEYWAHPIVRENDVVGRVVAFVDTSERKAAEATIERLAFYDPLTDLPNRRLLRDHLDRVVAWSHRSGTVVALLYLDLDRFKYVNDTLGHPVGDGLLVEVGTRLTHCVRDNDMVARLGGDEFAVVVGNIQHIEDAGAVAEKILAELDAPFRIDGHEVYVSTSIGISLYPNDTQVIDELIRNADIAMYQAKDKGKATFQYYDEAVNALTVERLDLEHGLRRAIERDELVLEYQPKLDLRSGEIFAVEALMRWNHPTLGRVPPARFIPLAEESRLIIPLGEWALRQACRDAASWDRQGAADIGLSVNLSPVQFRCKDLLDSIRHVLADADFPPQRLELEITEGALMDDPDKAAEILSALREAGVTVSIDDFGTGYSSLGHLKHFPVSVLKIDRSFVRDINSDPDDRAIAEAVIALARSLRLASIAEGVETEDQLRTLKELDCDAIQGYYTGRPMPPDDLLQLLSRRRTGGEALRAAV